MNESQMKIMTETLLFQDTWISEHFLSKLSVKHCLLLFECKYNILIEE